METSIKQGATDTGGAQVYYILDYVLTFDKAADILYFTKYDMPKGLSWVTKRRSAFDIATEKYLKENPGFKRKKENDKVKNEYRLNKR